MGELSASSFPASSLPAHCRSSVLLEPGDRQLHAARRRLVVGIRVVACHRKLGTLHQEKRFLEDIRRRPVLQDVLEQQEHLGAAIRLPGRHLQRLRSRKQIGSKSDRIRIDQKRRGCAEFLRGRVRRNITGRLQDEIRQAVGGRRVCEVEAERPTILDLCSGTSIVNFSDDMRPRRDAISGSFGQRGDAIPGRPAPQPLPSLLQNEERGPDDAAVAGFEFQCPHPSFGRQSEIHDGALDFVRLARGNDVGGQLSQQVGLPELPVVEVGLDRDTTARTFRCLCHVQQDRLTCGPGTITLHPRHDECEFTQGETVVVSELAVPWHRTPRRHVPPQRFFFDGASPWPRFLVGGQREGQVLLAMACHAPLAQDPYDLPVEQHSGADELVGESRSRPERPHDPHTRGQNR